MMNGGGQIYFEDMPYFRMSENIECVVTEDQIIWSAHLPRDPYPLKTPVSNRSKFVDQTLGFFLHPEII